MMTVAPMRARAFATFALLSSLVLMPQPSLATVFPQRALGISPAERGVAADVPRARGVRDLGRLRGTKPVEIGLLLAVRNLAQLQSLTRLQGNSRSPLYHHYLSSAQFANYFAPDPASYARTIATLRKRGFRITSTYPNRSFLRAAAPAATVERYFSTELHAVLQERHGVRFTNVRPAVMPRELRDAVVALSGIHSIVTMRHPIRFADRATILRSQQYAIARLYNQQHAREIAEHQALIRTAALARRRPFNVPTPLSTATAVPGPDATEIPGDPDTDYLNSLGGYDPTIYADAYDYPVQHGYGGADHPTASVIDSDFADSDANLQITTFGIPRTGKNYRECGDPAATMGCDNVIGQPDRDGESTLDALTIISLAPAADFYEYLAPLFDDLAIESAYELAINQNVADVVNSSFGGCETDDPSFGYASNYIAMEGAVLGITFSASTGDTGATNCGVYTTNGAPETEINISNPSSGYYFTATGGTDFHPITTCSGVGSACYSGENGWTFGGGGYSVYNPLPDWQTAAVGAAVATSVSTLGRNTPDVSFTADELPPGVGMDVFIGGVQEAVGGTSVASPMFTALQSEINEVQNSRNGWVNPGLYTAFTTFHTLTTNFAFRDVVGGFNGAYAAAAGYDDSTGLGSPLGWELAAVENGYPGATPRPSPATPPPGTVTPAPSPSPTPTSMPIPLARTAPRNHVR